MLTTLLLNKQSKYRMRFVWCKPVCLAKEIDLEAMCRRVGNSSMTAHEMEFYLQKDKYYAKKFIGFAIEEVRTGRLFELNNFIHTMTVACKMLTLNIAYLNFDLPDFTEFADCITSGDYDEHFHTLLDHNLRYGGTSPLVIVWNAPNTIPWDLTNGKTFTSVRDDLSAYYKNINLRNFN